MAAGIIAALQRSRATHPIEHGGLVALIALVIYGLFASRWLVDADGAEFAALSAVGGGAHPSGYPLYVLWLRAWSWLPGATPAHTAALATALLGALAIGTLHAACRAWDARPLAATIAVVVAATAPAVLHFHCQAEAFAMNNLAVALVLWLAARAGPLHGARRGFALGLVAGLGLSNHLTCVLVAPIGLYGVVRAARESRPSTYALALTGLVVGLLPYVYLLIAESPASWGRVTSLSGLVSTFLRVEYGITGLVPDVELPWRVTVGACLATIARSWLWIGAIAGIAMLGIRIWRPGRETRWAWALLAASFALAGPILATRFNIEPQGIGLYISRRFHILPTLLLTIPVAAAVDTAMSWLARRREQAAAQASSPLVTEGASEPSAAARAFAPPVARASAAPIVQATAPPVARASAPFAAGEATAPPEALASASLSTPAMHAPRPPDSPERALAVPVLALVGFVALAVAALPQMARLHSPAMELGIRNLLRSLPPDAIAVVISEDQCFGGRYLQHARGERPDVAFICSELLRRDWYRAAWATRGIRMPADPGKPLGDALLATGRPVFVPRHLSALLAAYPTYPFGVLYRVLPAAFAPPSAAEIAATNRDLYRIFDLDYPHPGRDDDFAAEAHRRYTGTWAAIANLLDAAGDHDAARDAIEVGRSLQPLQD